MVYELLHHSSAWRLDGGTETDTLTLLDHINREKLALGSYQFPYSHAQGKSAEGKVREEVDRIRINLGL